MISEEKLFDYISERVNKTASDTEMGIKMFIPMYSAILGGSIWLRLQLKEPAATFAYLSDILMGLLALVCIYIVIDNLRAWWGYKIDLANLTKKSKYPQSEPKWTSAIIEVVYCVAMLIALGLFVWFNPFQISNLKVA